MRLNLMLKNPPPPPKKSIWLVQKVYVYIFLKLFSKLCCWSFLEKKLVGLVTYWRFCFFFWIFFLNLKWKGLFNQIIDQLVILALLWHTSWQVQWYITMSLSLHSASLRDTHRSVSVLSVSRDCPQTFSSSEKEGQLSEVITACGHADGTRGTQPLDCTPEKDGFPLNSCFFTRLYCNKLVLGPKFFTRVRWIFSHEGC